MLMKTAREEIVAYGNRMIADGLTVGTAGNISVYDPELGYMAISPSGIPYADTTPEDVVIMDLHGNIVEGDRKPSSEFALHSAFYLADIGARAVVHAHSMFCTTLSCMGEPLRSVHYAIAEAGTNELPLVPYHTFGTPELAAATADALKSGSRGVILANHGMCASGASLKNAYGLALTMEWCAEVQWRCMSTGKMNVLTKEEMDVALEHYKTYGQKKSGDNQVTGYNG